jgi:succinoglycan biosynthesis protein ExoA
MDARMADVKTIGHDPALARRILVVVPTLDEERFIEPCLRSLLVGSEGIEIVVMDGGSRDNTVAVVERLAEHHENLRIAPNPGGRQASAVNLAARAANASRDILIRCDAHAVYPPGFLLGAALRLIEKNVASVVVPMDAAPEPGGGCFAKANAMIVDTPLGSGGSAHRGGHRSGYVDHGHHAAFWRGRFEALGGYDETMIANQDAEFDTRLRAAGGEIWLDHHLRITYFVRPTPGKLWRQYYRYGRGRADHVRKHRIWPRLRQIAPVVHVIAMGGCAALLAAGLPVGVVYPIAYGGLTIGGGAAVAVARRSACGLLAPLALWIMHTAWGLGFLRELAFGGRAR